MFDANNLLEMHWIWWVVIIAFILWILVTPNHRKGGRSKKDLQRTRLRRMLEKGQISNQEYEEQKQLLENE